MGALHPPSQIRRSAYLAQALQSIRRSGAQTLRTRGALASNLLAEVNGEAQQTRAGIVQGARAAIAEDAARAAVIQRLHSMNIDPRGL